jgi:hypothetical protein
MVPQFDPFKGRTVRANVALGCEIGTAESGDVELIRISIVECFSGETLIDSFARPSYLALLKFPSVHLSRFCLANLLCLPGLLNNSHGWPQHLLLRRHILSIERG